MIDKKARLEVEYLKMKTRLEDYEKEKKSENHEQFESLEIFIELMNELLHIIYVI